MVLRRIAVVLVLTIWPALSAASGGAVIDVQPTRLDLKPGRSGVLTLRNDGVETVRFEVFAHGWEQGVDGAMKLEPTQDVAFFPSLLEIPPGESRPIRIGVTRAPRDREASYRLVVRQIPGAAKESGAAIRVITEMSIPIFVAPEGARAEPRLEIGGVKDGKFEVQLSNPGNASYRPQRVLVKLLGDDGAELVQRTIPGWYVLAGGRLHHDVEIPADACTRLREVAVEAEVEGHAPLRARRRLACIPR